MSRNLGHNITLMNFGQVNFLGFSPVSNVQLRAAQVRWKIPVQYPALILYSNFHHFLRSPLCPSLWSSSHTVEHCQAVNNLVMITRAWRHSTLDYLRQYINQWTANVTLTWPLTIANFNLVCVLWYDFK